MKIQLKIMACILMFTGLARAQDVPVTVNDSVQKETEVKYAEIAEVKETEVKEVEVFESHTVAMGETVIMICKKYKVTPHDIYEYNKEAINGIAQGQVLSIPMHRTLKSNGNPGRQTTKKEENTAFADKKSNLSKKIPN